ncbi:MAG: hypothetical protein ACON35_03775 [Candidatus Marinamargulisbacteria bacterium]
MNISSTKRGLGIHTQAPAPKRQKRDQKSPSPNDVTQLIGASSSNPRLLAAESARAMPCRSTDIIIEGVNFNDQFSRAKRMFDKSTAKLDKLKRKDISDELISDIETFRTKTQERYEKVKRVKEILKTNHYKTHDLYTNFKKLKSDFRELIRSIKSIKIDLETVNEGNEFAGSATKISPSNKKIAQDEKSFETAVACYEAEIEELAVTTPMRYPKYEMSLKDLNSLGCKTGNDQAYRVDEIVFYKPANENKINLEWSGSGTIIKVPEEEGDKYIVDWTESCPTIKPRSDEDYKDLIDRLNNDITESHIENHKQTFIKLKDDVEALQKTAAEMRELRNAESKRQKRRLGFIMV